MLMTVDVGNTHIVLGGYDGDSLTFTVRVSTDTLKTEGEYAVIFSSLLKLHHVDIPEVSGVIISSVVPPLTGVMRKAFVTLFPAIKPLVLGEGVKTGLHAKIDTPSQLGADLIATAVAVKAKYALPAMIIDLGTATKMTVLDAEGNFCGGSIAPGVGISLRALSGGTAQLPSISLEGSVKLCGTNTVDCMRSGVVLGAAGMIDGMLSRYIAELGEFATIVACGGLVNAIIPHCHHNITIDNNLLLDGLHVIYTKAVTEAEAEG